MQQGFASLMYDSNNLKHTVSPNLLIWNFEKKKKDDLSAPLLKEKILLLLKLN